jgi:hypothetical protein
LNRGRAKVAFYRAAAIDGATMTTIARIPPNFNLREFGTEDKAQKFLQEFAFEQMGVRPDYTIWETTKEPKVRAKMYLDKRGIWVVARQRQEEWEE